MSWKRFCKNQSIQIKMNKLIIAVLLISCGITFSANAYEPNKRISSLNVEEMHIAQRKTVFRATQRLKARDGRQIYLYSSGKCELWDGDRLVVSTIYRLLDGEVRLLDENGNTVYKGSYILSRDRQNLSSLTISGTTYYKK